MFLKSLLPKERLTEDRGLHEQLFAATISKVRTVRETILSCINVRRTVLTLILTMMFVPFLTSVVGSQISANAAIDYSQPYNVEPSQYRITPNSAAFATVNDWRQIEITRDITGDVDYTSFRISAFGADNYGENFEKWLSVYVASGSLNGRVIYDSGWTISPIEEAPIQLSNQVPSIRVVYRIRYASGSNNTNPPVNNMFNSAMFILHYNKLQQLAAETTALPNNWTVDTTVSLSTYSTYPTVSTTIAADDVGDLVDSYSPINLVWFGEQLTILGGITGWIINDIPWVIALICWFLICSIIYWLLK